jgi:hypothetical protein
VVSESSANLRKIHLSGLLETLDLLLTQARAYERALPPDNYPARAAVATLGELARQALAEARDLAATLEPAPPSPHPLSPRELEVLNLVAAGLTNKEIAYRQIRSLIASAIRLITYQQNHTLPDYRRKITRIVEMVGVEDGRYVLQPLFTYHVDQGKLEATTARAGWEERVRRVITHG